MLYFSKFPLVFLFLSSLVGIQCRDFEVRDSADLRSGLDQVQPGDSINLIRDSELPKLVFRGRFVITRNGTASARIHFNGHPNITFTHNMDIWEGGIELNASYWDFKDLSIIAGGRKSFGFSISGNYNQISNAQISSYNGIIIKSGNFNKITNSRIFDCEFGIWMKDSSDNILENNHISQSKDTSIHIFRSSRNIIRNNSATIKDPGSSHLIIGNKQNMIIGNTFQIESSHVQTDKPFHFHIYDEHGGLFEGNHVIDSGSGTDSLILISTNQDPPISVEYSVIIASNTLITKYAVPLRLNFGASWVKFEGNQMEILEKKYPIQYCIYSDLDINDEGIIEFTSKNTEIRNDNICINGNLTNIFET